MLNLIDGTFHATYETMFSLLYYIMWAKVHFAYVLLYCLAIIGVRARGLGGLQPPPLTRAIQYFSGKS